MAARTNSSWAPRGPRSRSRPSLRMRFKCANRILIFFLRSRRDCGVRSRRGKGRRAREHILQKSKSNAVAALLVEYARLHDLTIMPASDERWYAEAVIFGSGRPTLMLQLNPRARPFALGTIAVAWDFSRAAARAVSDALPLLERAKKVRVVTVQNEKHFDKNHSAPARHRSRARTGFSSFWHENHRSVWRLPGAPRLGLVQH